MWNFWRCINMLYCTYSCTDVWITLLFSRHYDKSIAVLFSWCKNFRNRFDQLVWIKYFYLFLLYLLCHSVYMHALITTLCPFLFFCPPCSPHIEPNSPPQLPKIQPPVLAIPPLVFAPVDPASGPKLFKCERWPLYGRKDRWEPPDRSAGPEPLFLLRFSMSRWTVYSSKNKQKKSNCLFFFFTSMYFTS